MLNKPLFKFQTFMKSVAEAQLLWIFLQLPSPAQPALQLLPLRMKHSEAFLM